jgi:muconolactone delta-isomerase
MGTQRKKTIQELKEQPKIHVISRFSGKLKNLFLQDLEKGVEASDLLREMAREYYKNREDGSSKHGY